MAPLKKAAKPAIKRVGGPKKAAKVVSKRKPPALPEAPSPPGPPEPSDPKKRFLMHVGMVREPLLAAENARLDWEEVFEWLQDPGFIELVELNQDRYLARLENDLIEMGREKRNPMPLLAALNAHSADYGTIKRTFLDKLLAGFIKGVVKELKDVAPAPLLAKLSEILEREAERTSLRVPN